MEEAVNNCRNCAFADWHRNAAGAKQYGNYAQCTYQVQLPHIPASLDRGYNGSITKWVNRPRGVAEYDNKAVNCPVWQKEVK